MILTEVRLIVDPVAPVRIGKKRFNPSPQRAAVGCGEDTRGEARLARVNANVGSPHLFMPRDVGDMRPIRAIISPPYEIRDQ